MNLKNISFSRPSLNLRHLTFKMETNDVWKDQLIAGVQLNLVLKLKNLKIIGNLFIKHHKYTDPKLRHIWLSSDLERISWGEPVDTSVEGWERNRKEKGSIQVKVPYKLPFFLLISYFSSSFYEIHAFSILYFRKLSASFPDCIMPNQWIRRTLISECHVFSRSSPQNGLWN